ncbi:MAG: hypothetical protein ABI760_22925, partial [Ferruginibacter sp.]
LLLCFYSAFTLLLLCFYSAFENKPKESRRPGAYRTIIESKVVPGLGHDTTQSKTSFNSDSFLSPLQYLRV